MTKISMPDSVTKEEIDIDLQSVVEKGKSCLDSETWKAITDAVEMVEDPETEYTVTTSYTGTENA